MTPTERTALRGRIDERRPRNGEMFDAATILAIAGTFLLAGAVKGVIGSGLPAVSLAVLAAASTRRTRWPAPRAVFRDQRPAGGSRRPRAGPAAPDPAVPAGGGDHRAAGSVRADARGFLAADRAPRSAARGLRRREPSRLAIRGPGPSRKVGGRAGRTRERRTDGNDGVFRRAGGDAPTGARPLARRADPGDGDALHGVDAGARRRASGQRPAADGARRPLRHGACARDGGHGRRAANPQKALRAVVPQDILPLPPGAGRLPRLPRVRRLKKQTPRPADRGERRPHAQVNTAPPVRRRCAHFPAFAVRADSGDSGMMGEPIDPFGRGEFLKISINSAKIR